jgi:predicted O-methyltransferase YrrM
MTDLDLLYRKLEAVTGLYATLDLEAPLPPLGDWAIDPFMAVTIVNTILDVRPRLVVECGSGASTIVVGATLRKLGGRRRLVSVEHNSLYAGISRDHVRRHGLQQWAEVRHAPLVEGPHGLWYELSAFEVGGDIDLLLVDGPSTEIGPDARRPALPALYDKLSHDARILVDDAAREGEQAAIAAWQGNFPDLEFQILWTQNGCAFGIRRRSAGSPGDEDP